MFKLKKILCSVILLSSIGPMSVVHAGFGNDKLLLQDLDGSKAFTSVYKGPFAENQEDAYKEFFKQYLELKQRKQLIVDKAIGTAFRNKMIAKNATIGQYRKEVILNQIKTSGVICGGCYEISTFMSKILTDVGIENYLLYISELDSKKAEKSKHAANLIRLNDSWIVIDATLELQWTKENSFRCLNIPLVDYQSYLINELRFSNPYIGIQAASSEDKVKDGLAFTLDQFLLFNQLLRDFSPN